MAQAVAKCVFMAVVPGSATLCELPALRLRQAAFLCGSTLTGRKALVADNLYNLSKKRALTKRPTRILSIDLGVQNIGVCRISTSSAQTAQSQALVEMWERISLPPNLAFAYPEFSSAAMQVVNGQLSNKQVDVVVIERQRSRSAGSPMIPNSILRVNVLEGMVFTALQALYPQVYIESVSPKHVVEFWRYANANDAPEPERNAKATPSQSYRESKRVRRALLNRWIADPKAAPMLFDAAVNPGHKGKRDDMDDALVQALTWALWCKNSQRLLNNLEVGSDPLEGLQAIC